MKEMIRKFYNKIKSILDVILKGGDKIFTYFLEHNFGVNIVYAFLLVYITAIGIDKWGFASPIASANQVNFLNWSVGLWAFAFMFQAFSLLSLEKKVQKLKNTLNREWFIKFIEYQYKKNDISWFSGLTYIFSITISVLAVYMSFTSMQLSLDIAKSKEWIVNMSWTEEMFGILGEWIGVWIVVFILYFIGYKFNQLSKRNYLEKMYYWEYKKC